MASRLYQEVTPAGGTYPGPPSVTIPFQPDEVRFHPLAGAGNNAAYSFDGVNDHGKVFGGAPINSYVPERADELKVWLRVLAGAPVVGVSARTDPR